MLICPTLVGWQGKVEKHSISVATDVGQSLYNKRGSKYVRQWKTTCSSVLEYYCTLLNREI